MGRGRAGVVTVAQADVRLDDPHLTTDDRDRLGIREAIHEALVARRPDGGFAPALAASWEVAPDARTWRFAVRAGVCFHDGAPLRAEDVVASLERVRSPGRGGELGTGGVIAGYLAGARIEDGRDGAVTIVTAWPMADLPDLLVEIPIVAAGTDGGTVGAGPYLVDGVTEGEVRAAAFDGHWAGPPPLRGVRWVREPDPGARVAALLDGEVDLVTDLPADARGRVEAEGRLRVVDAPSSTCVAFLCNAAAGPCADPRVRRALNLGVDVDQLIRAAGKDGARPLNGPLTELHLGHDPATPPYRRDLDAARRLLAESGLGAGLALTIDVPTRMPDEAPALAELLSRQLAEIGVQVTVRSFEDRPGYADMVRAKQIDDLCCFDSTPLSTHRVLREKLHAGVCGPWWQGYANPEVDRVLDRAAATIALGERRELYRRAYRLIRDDAPWLFLYSPRLSWAAGRGVAWRPTPAGLVGLVAP